MVCEGLVSNDGRLEKGGNNCIDVVNEWNLRLLATSS